MRIATLPALGTLLLGGCVIYDRDCMEEEFPGSGGGGGSEDPEEVEPAFFLDPDIAEAGTSLIVSLTSDQAVDFATVAELTFYGDITICTTSVREDELLLSLVVEGDAVLGPVDLVIEFQDGTATFVDDAIEIVAAGDAGGDTGDGGTGDGGTGDTGGSDDGSGGGGC